MTIPPIIAMENRGKMKRPACGSGFSVMTVPEMDIPRLLDAVLAQAIRCRASDLHLEPTASGYDLRRRVDGMLVTVSQHPRAQGTAMVNRLMVLAGLLTYRMDVPQEGRFAVAGAGGAAGAGGPGGAAVDLRLSIMPTVHGIRAVIRLPGELHTPRELEELNLHPAAMTQLQRFAAGDEGMLICCGPAGSGKTTTLYAILQYMVEIRPHQSIITLEDPVERTVAGVTQIEVSPFGQLTYERALRSILRQDPQVLMLGEIRDPLTASLAMQGALSGHRLLCTLHASSPAGAIARLLEMGVEPYQLVATLWGVLGLRLVRRRVGGEVRRAGEAVGEYPLLASPKGKGKGKGEGDERTPPDERGYEGRVPLAQWVKLSPALRKAVLARSEPDELAAAIAGEAEQLTFAECAKWLVERGLTDAEELGRLGIGV